MDATATAPIYTGLPMWPTMATSTSPNSGTVMFDTIEGTAMRRILVCVVVGNLLLVELFLVDSPPCIDDVG